MSKVTALYHIVFNTRMRKMTIPMDRRRDLYAYIYGIIKKNGCHLLRINGISNHVHMLVDLSPSISLSDFVATVKRSSSMWMQDTPGFNYFEGWGREYFAASVSRDNAPEVTAYIINQETHHLGQSFEDELSDQIHNAGLQWNENMLT